MSSSGNSNTTRFSYYLFFSSCVINLLAFSTGAGYAWSSPVVPFLRQNNTDVNPLGRPITTMEESWITSLISLGACICPLFSGHCSDRVGRKRTIILFSVPMALSHLILAFAKQTWLFYISRFLIGLGAGCCYTVVPIYIGEIAETDIRGLLGCFLALFQCAGISFLYIIGPYVTVQSLSFLLMAPLLVFFALSKFLPESPHYLIAKGEEEKAAGVLRKLRKNHDDATGVVLEEMKEISELISESKRASSCGEIWRSRSFRKGITITCVIMLIQQGIGISILLSYMEPILMASDSEMSTSTSVTIIAVIQMVTVVVASYLVDRWGRKKLLIASNLFCALPSYAIGIFFYMKYAGYEVASLWWLPTLSLTVYMIGYYLGMGPLPYALLGELFANNAKALASALTIFTCLSLSFLAVLVEFPVLVHLVGYSGVFWSFGAAGTAAIIFIVWYIPETKGKSFHSILTILEE